MSFFKRYANDDFIILLLYVDDMLIVGHNPKKIVALEEKIKQVIRYERLGISKANSSDENTSRSIQKIIMTILGDMH